MKVDDRGLKLRFIELSWYYRLFRLFFHARKSSTFYDSHVSITCTELRSGTSIL